MNAKWYIKIALVFLLGIALLGLVVMLLWNWLMTEIFGLPRIDYWQSIGLMLLSKILLHPKQPPKWIKEQHWKNKFAARTKNLDPEERERLREEFKKRWCGGE